MISNYINHIAFALDSSQSIADSGLTDTIIKVFDNQIRYLAQRSKELEQETRVSIYTFADSVTPLVYDRDVLRLPSIEGLYQPAGWTAMIDGTLKAIEDLEKTAMLYGNHAMLVYTIGDGLENRSRNSPATLATKLKGLPDFWTTACFVPDQNGLFEAKKSGYLATNISIWDATSKKGVQEVGEVLRQTTDTFMRARATGVRGTKNLFSLDTSKVNTQAVKTTLKELSPTEYFVFPVGRKVAIKDFVESWTKEPYRIGSAYFALSKPEKVQSHKQICIQHKTTGKVYSGPNARKLLGLPDCEVKVAPADFNDYQIFTQSTSVNRLLVPGTNLLVMK